MALGLLRKPPISVIYLDDIVFVLGGIYHSPSQRTQILHYALEFSQRFWELLYGSDGEG